MKYRKYRFGLLMIATTLALFACGGKEKPPLTPDVPETETSAGDAGTLPEPDPK
ncbi:hypothetical protein LVJ94_36780 [Pendulispora rubella]|uniref:Lipoprotein n=1 Tax=Pendulispora rubella TaxID=2741070 RepID=A0ABZ2KZQ4_9BACT